MRRFRRLVRRLAKPAAMVGVVGVLSVSLIVAAPSNAYAFGNGSDLLEKAAPRISGAIKTIAPVAGPVAAVATSVTPVGWALKGGYSLVMLAFSTSDLWMPWVLEAGSTFGNPEYDKNASGDYKTLAGYRLAGYSLSGNTITMHQTYSVTTGTSKSTTIATQFKCRTNVLSSRGPAGTVYIKGFTWSDNALPTRNAWSTSGNACDSGRADTILGGSMGPSTTNLNGPENTLTFGDLAPPGFNPAAPETGYQGKSECIDAAGTVSWISGPVVAGDAGGVQMPSCEAAGKGHGTGRTQVIAFKPDGTQQPVWDVPVAPSDPSTPMCDPGRSSGGCVLSVELDGKGCEAGNVECENWAEIQKQDPNNSRLKCRFGPYTLPMSACNLLEQAYRAGGAIATERNTDGDPSTRDDNNYAGQPVPQPAPAPVAGTIPGAAPVPGGAGQTAPNADEKDRQCFPTGWAAFNPLEWIVKPMRCLWEPSRDVSQMGQIFREKAQTKAPVSFITAFSGMEAPGGGGCPNWVVTVGSQFSQNAVCDSSFTAAIRGIRAPLFGIVAAAMVWPLLRGIWYASIPILRVTPTGGK